MRRRLLLRLGVFLLLGAIVNVGVAWGCVTRDALRSSGLGTGTPFDSLIFPPYQQQELTDIKVISGLQGFGVEVVDAIAMTKQAPVGLRTVYAGWPLHSLTGAEINHSIRSGAIEQILASPISIPRNRLIPLLPIWPGFAINTAFYAAILWLLFAAPGRIRRAIRRKRGLCPKCAYDLRGRGSTSGNVCPECGTVIQRVAACQ